MTTPPKDQFDSLESAQQYIALLSEVLEQTRTSIYEELEVAEEAGAARSIDALQLVAYKLERLRHHLDGSRRVLNDLRMLRRILQVDDADGPEGTVSYNQGDAFARDPQ